MSIAAGIYLGDFSQIGLTTPSAMGSIIIAKHQNYHNVIKATQWRSWNEV
jgi:hypothetical protein